jgi:3',5'-cyclic-nucleotide phosphodiesterase
MITHIRATVFAAGLLAACGIVASAGAADAFDLVALGVEGGLDDGNLSAWLLRAPGDSRYLALDAGSLLPGIDVALQRGAFADLPRDPALTAAGDVLRNGIAGYFVSHPHLDHVAGLLIAATDDSRKPVYGLASTLKALSDDYFNWRAWPNFSDRGAPPRLAQYRLTDEKAAAPFAITGTTLEGRLYPLTHDRTVSSTILLRSGDAYLAYFGDTGADAVQHSEQLAAVWRVLAPLQARHALKAIIIECSYPDDVADDRLYGHLKPSWLLIELHRLEMMAGGPGALRGLDVVVSHIKPSLRADRDPRARIAGQLASDHALGVRWHLPVQGATLSLPTGPRVGP